MSTMASEFSPGDVVYITVDGHPHGLAIVCGSEPASRAGTLLKIHDGTGCRRYHYMHAGWCRKVGEVGGDVLAFCEREDARTAKLDEDRVERFAGPAQEST